MSSISLEQLASALQLENLTPEIPLYDIHIDTAEINRPALQLGGFMQHFDPSRVQIIGLVEHAYVNSLEPEARVQAFERILSSRIPCLIMCRGFKPLPDVVSLALRYHVPILSTTMATSLFEARIMRLLEVRLASMVAVHGGLVDVYGEGVLILGDSGVGKSETALELIKRGHRLVADDTVEIRRYSENELYGRAPEVTRYLMELRGIGVIDVKALYGVASVKDEKRISMAVRLQAWDDKKIVDRLGIKEEYVEYLGNKVVCYSLPLSAGRNAAVLIETAAINFRQKRMGYDAMKELEKRVAEQLMKNRE